MRISLADAKVKYGIIAEGKWAEEANHCIVVQVPDPLCQTWINTLTGQPTQRIYCNRDMAGSLYQALQNVIARGLAHELETFDGCLMVRSIRGDEETVSTHAYALAIDLNARWNRLGQPPTLSHALVKCFTDEGFLWGGDFRRKDGMHFQLAAW